MNHNCFSSQNYNPVTEDIKILTPKTSYSFVNKRSQSVKKGKSKENKKPNNTNRSLNDTSKIYSSSECYWEKRYNDNQSKMNELKRQREEKEMKELRRKPKISKRSKQIVENLINQPYRTSPVQSSRTIPQEVKVTQINQKQQVNNLRGVDDLYQKSKLQKCEETIQNNQINNIHYSNENHTPIINHNQLIVASSIKKQPSIPKPKRTIKKKENNVPENPLMNIRKKLNEFYNNNERVNNYSSRVTFPENYMTDTINTNNSIPSQPIMTKKLIQPSTIEKQQPPTIINSIPKQQIESNSLQINNQNNDIILNSTNNNQIETINHSDIKNVEESYQKSINLHSQIMNNLYPDSYSSQIIRNNPIASYREENNKRLKDLTYLSNYANNLSQSQKTNQVLSNKEQPIDNTMKLAYIKSETAAAERSLDYLNQKLRINQHKKEAILNQYNTPILNTPSYLNSNTFNQNTYTFYNYDDVKENGNSNYPLDNRELLDEFRFQRRK